MNKITSIFGIKYPIIQAGMVWCSGWKLASAVSNSGGLGLIGAGSMHPETLIEHINKCNLATKNPFGINIPLMYPEIEIIIKIVIEKKIKIVFTSAGNPAIYTQRLKDNGITVFHVIASSKFAKKSIDAGVDGLVAEGFEAGGHNGIEETTTMTLIPIIRELTDKPLIAAGGIATGRGMLAAMALGADGVQIGTAFAASEESSANIEFKKKIIEAKDGDTQLLMKKLIPVRLLKNRFFDEVKSAEERGATREELQKILGKGKAKKGMFEGDIENGELEIGQISSLINKILPASEIINNIINEYYNAKNEICGEGYTF